MRLTHQQHSRLRGPSFDTYIFGSEGTIGLTEDEVFLHNISEKGWRNIEAPPDTNQFAEILEWIEGKRSHRCDAEKVRGTMEIMMAIYESVRTKGLVRLPLKTKGIPFRDDNRVWIFASREKGEI
ncbi:MAG: hypothetical protein ACUVTL_10515 [Thermoproteota archaeon]